MVGDKTGSEATNTSTMTNKTLKIQVMARGVKTQAFDH
jgi:hypothetical protein